MLGNLLTFEKELKAIQQTLHSREKSATLYVRESNRFPELLELQWRTCQLNIRHFILHNNYCDLYILKLSMANLEIQFHHLGEHLVNTLVL